MRFCSKQDAGSSGALALTAVCAQGFALSEMWRAPAAIMIRDVSPPNLGSTGSAVHLCVRNLIGGLGPLGALRGCVFPRHSHTSCPRVACSEARA